MELKIVSNNVSCNSQMKLLMTAITAGACWLDT